MDEGSGRGGAELGGVEEGKTVVGIYCMGEERIFNSKMCW